MDLPKALRCPCGYPPSFFKIDSSIENLNTKAKARFSSYAVRCTVCDLSTGLIEEDQGGVETAAIIWNHLVSHRKD